MSSEWSKKNARGNQTTRYKRYELGEKERDGTDILASIYYESRVPRFARGGRKINESSSSLAVERLRANKCNTRCSICIYFHNDAVESDLRVHFEKSFRRVSCWSCELAAIGPRSRIKRDRDARRDVRMHVKQLYLSRAVLSKNIKLGRAARDECTLSSELASERALPLDKLKNSKPN